MNKKEIAKPLTKKYLVKIADSFKKFAPIDIRLVNELMDIFEDMNPRFNRGIFLNAVLKKDMQFQDIIKENKILKSKVKCYEQDNNKRFEEIEVQNFENDLNSVNN
tara:strand:+ start:1022 stop:1339 length:318 start_codon:yes stop_codon:yes gene_type:complete